jgi:preprotein translocase subunit SecF
MFSLMKFRNWYLGFSAFLLVVGITSIALRGFELSVDFIGGSSLEIQTPATVSSLTVDEVQNTVGPLYELSSVQGAGNNHWVLKGKLLTNEQKDQVLAKLSQTYGPVQELRFDSVGPTLGRELLSKTLFAVVLAAVLITTYVARQFKELKYGVSAILAMLHDTIVLLGAFSILGWWWGVEVDVLFVTALLTTLSFSVHDTIVVFDRIREIKRKHAAIDFVTVVDTAVLQTLGRSLNNSLTIILMLIALVALGGDTIRWFAVALLVGAVTGTYSSTFVAAPLLLLWEEIKAKRDVKKTNR